MGNKWIPGIDNNKGWIFALFVGICGGLVSVLVDIDHLWLPRSAHIPLFIGAGIVAFYYCACLGGLYIGVVLKNRQK